MAKKEKASLPQSTAGLVRYFDDYNESITIKPEYVVGTVVLLLLLKIYTSIY